MVNAFEKNKEIDPQLCGRFATDSYIAIDIAHKYNWVNLWVETDSSFVVWLFHSNSTHLPWNFKNRWLRAVHRARLLNARVSHIYQEGNCVADKLASLATSSGTSFWHFSSLESLQRLICRDMTHLPFYRFRNL